jgi:hypothetical protein
VGGLQKRRRHGAPPMKRLGAQLSHCLIKCS